MSENYSVKEMLEKLQLEREVERQRKYRHINRECPVCDGYLIMEAGCLICHSCGESSC